MSVASGIQNTVCLPNPKSAEAALAFHPNLA